MTSISQNSRMRTDRRGATTVEFAVILPVLFSVMFGAIEFGRANQITNATAFSAYQGCRQAIIPGGSASAAQSAAQQVLASNFVTSGYTVTVTPSTITNTTTTVTVQVAVKLDSAAWIPATFTRAKTVSRSCTLTREKTN